jgi:uncharacterized SAM-binding protein YcdF (DUF218 family)
MQRIALYLVQPYTLAYLVTGVALVSLWRKRQATRARLLLLSSGFAMLTVLNLPVVSYLGIGSLEWSFPPLRELQDDATAIVVLSGSMDPPDSVRRTAAMGSDTLHRCLYAAEVYRLRGKHQPILVSGGNGDADSSSPACAELMKEFLIKVGVESSDLMTEPNSHSTYENAVECRKQLERRGIRKIILVTEAWHMARAVLCFRKQGIGVVPAACHHRATDFEWSILAFLPSPTAADGVSDAVHEWLGLTWYWSRGRI